MPYCWQGSIGLSLIKVCDLACDPVYRPGVLPKVVCDAESLSGYRVPTPDPVLSPLVLFWRQSVTIRLLPVAPIVDCIRRWGLEGGELSRTHALGLASCHDLELGSENVSRAP